jgi:transcriptional regulator with XRE-family HTH domain
VDEDFSPGWQVRAGARAMANQLEVRIRTEEAATSSLSILGRYVRRSRRQLRLTQAAFAERAGVSQSMVSRLERGRAAQMPLESLLKISVALGRLFPFGACPHDHPCAWQPVRPPPAASEGGAYLETLLIEAGETLDPGPSAHHAADMEIGVELNEIGPLAGREAAAIADAEHLEGVARRRGDRGG